jgi:hypothetical protein
MTETRRRSEADLAITSVVMGSETPFPSGGRGSEAAAAVRADPHSPQNFVPGAFGEPHDAQATASPRPHSPQNFRVPSF